MPEIVVDQPKGASFAQHVDILLGFVAGAVVVILRAGHKCRGAQWLVNRVVVVEDHRPPGVVIAHFWRSPNSCLCASFAPCAPAR